MYRYVQIASPFESGSPWKNVSIVSLQIKNKQWCSLPVKHGDPRTPCFLWNWYDVFIVLSRKRLITHHHHVSSSFWLITPWYIHVVKPTVCVTFDFRRITTSHTCEYSNPHVIPMLSLCMVKNLRRESHSFSVTLPVLEAFQWAPSPICWLHGPPEPGESGAALDSLRFFEICGATEMSGKKKNANHQKKPLCMSNLPAAAFLGK